MENQQPEALILVADRPSAIGDDLYQWALDAEDMIRRIHARNQELEKDLGNAKRLVSKIWNQHPEARDTIEKATGAWLVFGQDVETDGVSAQRVTQAAYHIEQPLEMVAAPAEVVPSKAPVVLPEPVAWLVYLPGEEAQRVYDDQDDRGYVDDLTNNDDAEVSNLYTEQQVRDLLDKATCTKSQTTAPEPFGYFKAEPFGWRDCAETDEGAVALYEAPQPQADARDAERWSEIGKSIERACGELPEDFEINIHLENGAGTVVLLYPNGEECENFPHDDGLAGVVNAAIDAAIAAAKGMK